MSAPRSRLLPPVVGLVAAAAVLWGASRLTWLDVTATNDQSGEAARTVTGAEWQPALVPLALVSVAAVAAVALARGVAARVLGVVIVLVALGCAVPVVDSVGSVDADRVHAAVTSTESAGTTTSGAGGGASSLPEWSRVSRVDVRPSGPASAGCAGVLLLLVGAGLILRPPARRATDDRYTVPDGGATNRTGTGGDATDHGRGMWETLDAGEDPTA